MSADEHLNPDQHKGSLVYTHTKADVGIGSAVHNYKLTRRTTTPTGETNTHEVGHLRTYSHSGRPEIIGDVPSSPSAYNASWYRGDRPDTSTSVRQEVPDPYYGGTYEKQVGRQGRLFPYMPPTRAEHKVDALWGTREHRAANMVMLGMAENVAREAGTTLLPSNDLSEHSSRLVEHLKGAGVVHEGAETRVTNEIQFMPPELMSSGDVGKNHPAPKEEVEAGRKTLRSVIRGGKPRQVKGQQPLF